MRIRQSLPLKRKENSSSLDLFQSDGLFLSKGLLEGEIRKKELEQATRKQARTWPL